MLLTSFITLNLFEPESKFSKFFAYKQNKLCSKFIPRVSLSFALPTVAFVIIYFVRTL